MTSAPEVEAPQVVVRRRGRVGHLTLNRPRAINALTLAMIREMQSALDSWLEDGAVEVVLLDGAGPRGFCAGGDIRVVHESARTGSAVALQLWREEYVLDATIAGYPKPVVSMVDGITMGGGVGLGCHGVHRVATQRSLLSMPEVSIGLAPDVGAHLLLARAPGELGTYLALTAARIGPADALLCGLVDHVVRAGQLGAVAGRLEHSSPRQAVEPSELTDQEVGVAPLRAARGWIDECFTGEDAGEILSRLLGHGDGDARAAGSRLAAMSPLAVSVSLRGLREARRLDDLHPVLVNDYRSISRSLRTHDLPEGIRAAILDKDRTPVWAPSTLEGVTPEMVERHFCPLGGAELDLHGVPAPLR